MEDLLRDVRLAWRRLLVRPGFALVAMLTIGLGVGANSAIFSVVYGVLLRPLPYAEPEGLVRLWEERQGLSGGPRLGGLSSRTFDVLRERSRTFEELAIYEETGLTLSGLNEPQRLSAVRISASIFPMLRAAPSLGRVFEPREEAFGSHRVAVLSDRTWRRVLGADPAIVGRTVLLDGEGYTVLGVMPAAFQFPDSSVELWLPFTEVAEEEDGHAHRIVVLPAVGRLRPGVAVEAAEAEGETVLAALLNEQPELARLAPARFRVADLRQQLVAPVRPALLALSGAVGLVLLIACANVANLLLVRSLARRRELAICQSLGAGRGRLAVQSLSESLLLALLGGLAGIGLAAVLVRLLATLAPESVPRLDEIGVAPAVVLFNFAVALLTGILFGLVPALEATGGDAVAVLRTAGAATAPRASRRGLGRGALTVIEVALSLVLLTGAGLLVRSFLTLVSVDAGYRPEGVLTAELELPDAAYPDVPSKIAFIDALLDRARELPQTLVAGAVNFLPLNPSQVMLGLRIEGYEPPPGEEGPPRANLRLVSPDYFRAMGIELLEGRDFGAADRQGSPPVVIVDRAFVERFFAERDALGAGLGLGEIVGIVDNVRHAGLDSAPQPTFYLDYRQAPPMMGMLLQSVSLAVLTEDSPLAVAPALRAQLEQIDPGLAFGSILTMEQRLADSVALPRFYAALLGGFAVVALALAAVGLFGVLSFSVRQRTRETGVRLALGARAVDVVRLVVGEGLALVGIGIALGLVGAVLLSRLLESLLFGVGRLDPVAFLGATVVLVVAAGVACLVPAIRATRIDPTVALRFE